MLLGNIGKNYIVDDITVATDTNFMIMMKLCVYIIVIQDIYPQSPYYKSNIEIEDNAVVDARGIIL